MQRDMDHFRLTQEKSNRLLKLQEALLSIPPTSVESERSFSSAGLLCTKISAWGWYIKVSPITANLHQTECCIKQEHTVTMRMTLQTMNLDFCNNDGDGEEDGWDVARPEDGLIDDCPFLLRFFTSNYCFCGRVKKAGCNLTKGLLCFNSGRQKHGPAQDPLFIRTFETMSYNMCRYVSIPARRHQ